MDLIQGSLADTEHERTLLLETDVCRTLDQVGTRTIGDPPKRTHAARDNHHGISRIRSAGDIRSDIGIVLLMNFAARRADDLTDDSASSAKTKFLGQHSKSAVGGDEIHGANSPVALDRHQQMFKEQSATGAGGRNGQILGWMFGQSCTES